MNHLYAMQSVDFVSMNMKMYWLCLRGAGYLLNLIGLSSLQVQCQSVGAAIYSQILKSILQAADFISMFHA